MRIIYFLSLILVANIAFANKQDIKITKAQYAIDTNSLWDIDNLSAKKFNNFSNSNLNIGYNINTTVWCIYKLKNTNVNYSSKTWLCFYNNFLDSVVLYHQGYQTILGDRTTGQSQFLDAQAFEINLKPNQETIVCVKIKKCISSLQFSYGLASDSYLTKRSNIKIATVSLLMGFIFSLVLFNCILCFISKNKVYVYYLIFSLLTCIYVLISSNYAKNFLFPHFLYFSESLIITGSLWIIIFSIFITLYLNLERHQPKKYKIVYSLNALNIGLLILTIILFVFDRLNYLKLCSTLRYVTCIAVIIALWWSSIAHLKTNIKEALYVLLAFFPQLVWCISIILKSFELIPKSINLNWLTFICIYEVIFFGYLLSKKYIDTLIKNKTLLLEITTEKEKSLQAITQVQIRERRNIANIIHDNLGSKIAYISHLLQLKKISLANHNIKQLANDIREISHQILPKSLDEGALTPSLKKQIATLNASLPNTKIDFFCYDFPEKTNEVWVYDIYLITLEIINNALKHGKASNIDIEFFGYTDQYLFQFTDNGEGFDLTRNYKGFGLENIEKRVKYYKGTFEINSSKLQGTVIQIAIPV